MRASILRPGLVFVTAAAVVAGALILTNAPALEAVAGMKNGYAAYGGTRLRLLPDLDVLKVAGWASLGLWLGFLLPAFLVLGGKRGRLCLVLFFLGCAAFALAWMPFHYFWQGGHYLSFIPISSLLGALAAAGAVAAGGRASRDLPERMRLFSIVAASAVVTVAALTVLASVPRQLRFLLAAPAAAQPGHGAWHYYYFGVLDHLKLLEIAGGAFAFGFLLGLGLGWERLRLAPAAGSLPPREAGAAG